MGGQGRGGRGGGVVIRLNDAFRPNTALVVALVLNAKFFFPTL